MESSGSINHVAWRRKGGFPQSLALLGDQPPHTEEKLLTLWGGCQISKKEPGELLVWLKGLRT